MVRLALGIVLTGGAVTASLLGFSDLTNALEATAYGSPAIRHALIVLGAAGAALGAGISLLIWEVSVRLDRY